MIFKWTHLFHYSSLLQFWSLSILSPRKSCHFYLRIVLSYKIPLPWEWTAIDPDHVLNLKLVMDSKWIDFWRSLDTSLGLCLQWNIFPFLFNDFFNCFLGTYCTHHNIQLCKIWYRFYLSLGALRHDSSSFSSIYACSWKTFYHLFMCFAFSLLLIEKLLYPGLILWCFAVVTC